jgi:hypothetical protein
MKHRTRTFDNLFHWIILVRESLSLSTLLIITTEEENRSLQYTHEQIAAQFLVKMEKSTATEATNKQKLKEIVDALPTSRFVLMIDPLSPSLFTETDCFHILSTGTLARDIMWAPLSVSLF